MQVAPANQADLILVFLSRKQELSHKRGETLMNHTCRVICTSAFSFFLSVILSVHLVMAQDNIVSNSGTANADSGLAVEFAAQLDFTDYPNDITSPDRPGGLAWDAGFFWVALNSDPAKIIKLNSSGETTASLDPPAGTVPAGLDFDGENLWLFDSAAGKAYHLATSGVLLGQVDLPEGASVGLAWDGSGLWVIDWSKLELYRLDPDSGEILKTITTSGMGVSKAYGLAWFKDYLWASNADGIYKINPQTGTLEAIYKTEFNTGDSMGLTWDDSDAWGCGGSSFEIVKLDVSDSAVVTAVPTVYTGSAGANYYEATIYGSVRPNGLSTQAFFQMGRSISLDFETSRVNVGDGFSLMLVWANFYDLRPRTRYYYRIGATNSMGSKYGETYSFRTDDDGDWLGSGECFLDSIK